MKAYAALRRTLAPRRLSAGRPPWGCLTACLLTLCLTGSAAALPRETWKGQPDGIRALALSPDGKTLASYAGDGSVTLWDLATGKQTTTLISDQRPGVRLAFTPDGKLLVAIGVRRANKGEPESKFSRCSAKVWDLTTRNVRLTIDFPDGADEMLTPDGKSLIATEPKSGVLLYDLGTGKPSEPLDLSKDHPTVYVTALSPDGKTLALVTHPTAILLWDMDKKAVRATLPAGKDTGVDVMAFSPDGKTLATSGGWAGGLADLWDVGSGKLIDKVDVDPRVSGVKVMAFSPDGKTVAVGGGRWGVSLWDLAAAGERDDFGGDLNTGAVLCAVFTPDGKTLITGGLDRDKAIWFWDVPPGKARGVKPPRQPTPLEVKQLHDAFPPKP